MDVSYERNPLADKIFGVTIRLTFIELSSDENALSRL